MRAVVVHVWTFLMALVMASAVVVLAAAVEPLRVSQEGYADLLLAATLGLFGAFTVGRVRRQRRL